MSGLVDRISGRAKKAAGDLLGDPKLRQRGVQEEQKADAKDELARAQKAADRSAEEIARLEREGARGRAKRQARASTGGQGTSRSSGAR
jgi:uncharacterized protein YjbJ (UPF0337 family)